MENVVNFNPPGPVARRFMLDDHRIRVICGPFGSGKSVTCVMELMRRAMEQKPGPDGLRHSRWAVVRNTTPQLRDTTIKTFHEWIPPGLAGKWMESTKTFFIRFNDVRCEVMFRALDDADDVRKLLSLELTGAWLNECREIDEAIVRGVDGRIGRYPSKAKGGPTWTGIIADTNMPNVDTYWYQQMEGEVPDPVAHFRKWAIFFQPSGLSDEAENIENLSEGRDYYVNLATDNPPDFVDVNVHAKYGRSLAGKPVYDRTFDRDVHIAKGPLVYNPFKPLIIGMDFGRDPSAIFCQFTAQGRFVVVDELCRNNMGLKTFIAQTLNPHLREQYADILQENITISGDPSGQFKSQFDERTCFSILKDAGFHVVAPKTNNVGPRLEAVEHFLTSRIPGMLIAPHCKKIIRGFEGGYRYPKKQNGLYGDSPEKNEYSHPHDALQYACMYAKDGAAREARRRKTQHFRVHYHRGPADTMMGY